MRPIAFTFVVAAASLLCMVPAASGQGVLVPTPRPDGAATPPFVIEAHRARVTISRQIATAEVDLSFQNPGQVEAEGTLLFPVPQGTAVQDMTIRAGDQVLEAELLPADEARRLYESIVNQRKDPALLEFAGNACIRARVFPIPAGGRVSLNLSYATLATREGDVVRWVHPLRALRQGAPPENGVSVSVRIEEKEQVRSVYSPTHEVEIARDGDSIAEIVYAPTVAYLEEDLILYYTLSPSDVAIHVLSHQAGEDEPFFAVLAAPRVEGFASVPKDVVFVIDTSGSMRGEKWDQAVKAIQGCLDRLAPEDRFGIVGFSTDVRLFSNALSPATPESLAQAKGFVEAQRVNGGTQLEGALRAGLELFGETSDESRETFLLAITDGLPTIGERDPARVVQKFATANAHKARFFSFGVGYDVDTQLLDRLVQDHGGWADYVHPGESLDQRVATFFRKIETPVVSAPALEVEGLRASDVYPRELPPLFAGGQILVFGKVDVVGEATFRLRGKVRGQEVVYETKHVFQKNKTDHSFLPVLWATRKIGYLIDQIRLYGQSTELVDEIVRLSKEYGVLTEYTSFFADEAGRADPAALRFQLEQNLERANQVRAGNWATNQALNLRNYREVSCGSQVNFLYANVGDRASRFSSVRRMGEKIFYLQGDTWFDAAYSGQIPVQEVALFSEGYWELNRARADMAQYQSLGKVLIVEEGRALLCK